MKILAVNPGSTSTKIAVFEQDKNIFQVTLRHSADELKPFANVAEQFAFRKEVILSELKKAGVNVSEISVVVGRGGIVKPVESGVYEVNEAMKTDLRSAKYGEHASNLGALIADDIARSLPAAKAYIADPVVVDEMQDVARVTGLPLFTRKSTFHALNQKAIARTYAREHGKKYEEVNLIVAHLGGGISVGAHRQGKVVDTNNAVGGDGAFSPERSGTTPALQLLEACFSGKYTKTELSKMLVGSGGLVAHLGTNDAQKVVALANQGDEQARLVLNAMCYQIGKEIGAAAAVLHGNVDAVLVTGGIAHNQPVTSYITQMTSFIAPVFVYPGEDEMTALVENVIQMLDGKLPLKTYA
ncbi:MAG: butyrate kinase [Prevotellaceae bacterium]|jgi:butyrate kinase|nr:butyrate kinase [Prevotellaceae bacterium]